jgi:hypothetical protein
MGLEAKKNPEFIRQSPSQPRLFIEISLGDVQPRRDQEVAEYGNTTFSFSMTASRLAFLRLKLVTFWAADNISAFIPPISRRMAATWLYDLWMLALKSCTTHQETREWPETRNEFGKTEWKKWMDGWT